MARRLSFSNELRDIEILHKMKQKIDEDVDEDEVELCLELARLYDTQDLTHPPPRHVQTEEKPDGE